jgi:lysophospholipase L1-like esterase
VSHDTISSNKFNNISFTRKNRIKYLFQTVFWIIVVLVGFEIFLRYFVSGLTPMSSFDPDLGPRPVAGSVIMFQKEGNGIIHYLADGEIATPYQGGVNITVFGDSQTSAFQVNDNQNYVSVAETKLRGKNLMVDLHNLGYPAGTLADYTYWASLTQSKFHSSIVVIQISTNDFFGSGGSEGYILSAVGNYFTKNTDGSLTLVHTPVLDKYAQFKPIISKSALLGYGVDRLRLFREIITIDSNDLKTANKMQPVSSAALPSDHQLANYRAQLTALHTAYQGQKVIIVVLPSSPSIADGQMVLDNSDYALLLKQVKQFDDWYVVDPLQAFQSLWIENHKLPRGFTNSEPGTGHLNVDGHAIVGQLLAEKIEEVVK